MKIHVPSNSYKTGRSDWASFKSVQPPAKMAPDNNINKQVTINLPPIEETTDPESAVNCFNWRNWLAFILVSLFVGTVVWLVINEGEWFDNAIKSFMQIREY